MSVPLLELDNVTIRFGGLTAVSEVSLQVAEGELIGLIGPNGAGKTTVFNMITGVYQPSDGKITFAGKLTAGVKPHVLTKSGMARTFQNIRLFGSMSVFDNVRVATQLHRAHGIRQALWRGRSHQASEKEVEAQVLELLEVFSLQDFRDEPATSLPYGGQRRLEIVRAMATQPRLLLLDEPTAGLDWSMRRQLVSLLAKLKTQWGLLVVSHDVGDLLDIADQCWTLQQGELVSVTPDQLREQASKPQLVS